MSKNSITRGFLLRMTVCALMSAMGVALAYFPRLFSGTFAGRIDFAILPVIIVAALYGPVWSGSAYLLTDLIGCLISGYPPFIPITVCKVIFAVMIGIVLYRRETDRPRVIIGLAILSVTFDLFFMALALKWYYVTQLPSGDKAWNVLLVIRLVTAALNYTISVIFTLFVAPRLCAFMRKRAAASVRQPKEMI